VLLPGKVFSGGVEGRRSREEIKAEEEGFIEDTEKEKLRWRRIANGMIAASAFFTGLTILIFGKWMISFWKNGKDEPLPRPSLSGRIWEPPSDISPAQVEQLINGTKELSGRTFAAVVLNLVMKRQVRLVRSANKEGTIIKEYRYFLERLKEPLGLDIIDLECSRFIFNKIDEEEIEDSYGRLKSMVKIDDLIKYCKSHRHATHTLFKKLQNLAIEKSVGQGFFDGKSHSMKRKTWVIAYMVGMAVLQGVLGWAILMVWSKVPGGWWRVGMAGAGFGLPMVFAQFVPLVKLHWEKRTEKGRKETALWLAFKEHMNEYRKTRGAPIDSVVMWEKFLVYGTVLGVSKKVLSSLPVRFSKTDEQHATGQWGYGGYGSGWSGGIGGGGGGFSSISSTFSSLSASVSSGYGASGVGGSGGGGGGGGGGGAG